VVVLVLVVGQDAIDSLPNHGEQGLLDKDRIAPVFQRRAELLGKPNPLIELSDGQQPGISGHRGRGKFDVNWPRREEIE
jgi:hypothetical protein